ncbi:MAG TPA: phenylalanine 4-monooxygenase [Candidatus Acidoferrales bacterium]|jgi:phenylalanine-4-hydroxylase|nr:phenylalanine 4-monooxygenase [Candidatus Acidoferrales bacterium]
MAETLVAPALAAGLTTGNAPFVEEARTRGQLYISQAYEQYSQENHGCWRRLFSRIRPRWEQYANSRFLEGIEALRLPSDRVPRLSDINRRLQPLTGFQAKPVSGYVPGFLFFDCLRRREFPTTITIRPADRLDYLPEPDIFHDIAGHVPMHTEKAFADTLVRFGDCAHTAAQMIAGIRDEAEQARRLTSIIRAMSRFFWFTVEFGLMRAPGGIRAYGSGLLSSYGELHHAIESPDVQRHPLQMEWVINQGAEIDRYQPLLFIVDSFDHLFEMVDRLERLMRDGKLFNVAPGLPEVNAGDLRSFLDAAKSW